MKRIYPILLFCFLFLSSLSSGVSVKTPKTDGILFGSVKNAMKIGLFTLINTQDVTGWLPSDDRQSEYGKGRFYYKLKRTISPDKTGFYYYEVWFISDSYYQANYYRNGKVYRSATKIDAMSLFVDNTPTINILTKSQTFWLLFQGNFEQGKGDLGIYFKSRNPNATVTINWSTPKPY